MQAQPATPPKPFDCSAPEHRQFDFWVGEWDVVPNAATAASNTPSPAAGRKPASNVIERIHNGCVLLENWDDRVGGTGQRSTFTIERRNDGIKRGWTPTWGVNYDLIYTRRAKTK